MRVRIDFSYRESAAHVYKHVSYYLDNKKVTARKNKIKDIIKDAPSILTTNCYFWRSGGSSSSRRYNEKKRHQEVKEWALTQNFKIISEGSTSLTIEKEI